MRTHRKHGLACRPYPTILHQQILAKSLKRSGFFSFFNEATDTKFQNISLLTYSTTWLSVNMKHFFCKNFLSARTQQLQFLQQSHPPDRPWCTKYDILPPRDCAIPHNKRKNFVAPHCRGDWAPSKNRKKLHTILSRSEWTVASRRF